MIYILGKHVDLLTHYLQYCDLLKTPNDKLKISTKILPFLKHKMKQLKKHQFETIENNYFN